MSFALDLNIIWFVLVGILFTGYAMLDGFDLGVGALHLLARKDEDRRVFLNAIGPVWDGNEVWLVTGGGALFAAFPGVYATVFSGFYLAFILLLFALIFRAVAIEFRSKESWSWWRKLWDFSFSIGSLLSSLLIGIALGNIAWGISLGADREYHGSFFDLLHPYTILVGITTVALFMMHGAIYLLLKTDGDLHNQVRTWIRRTIIFFIVCYVITTVATLFFVPHMTEVFRHYPVFIIIPALNLLAVANVPREIHHGRDFRAFLSSCASMIALMMLFGLGMFPNMVYSKPHPEYSLTLYNAASSPKTLSIMLKIAVMGLPLVVAYTSVIYWVFRGKVRIRPSSY